MPSIKMNNKLLVFSLLIILSLLLSGCAKHYTPELWSDPYGFFCGIWHGIILPYSLVINLISWFLSLFGVDFLSDVQIIGKPNTGFFYYLGFFFGMGGLGFFVPR